eukprot:2830691-Alexandrium_andersonii.AAC.1
MLGPGQEARRRPVALARVRARLVALTDSPRGAVACSASAKRRGGGPLWLRARLRRGACLSEAGGVPLAGVPAA